MSRQINLDRECYPGGHYCNYYPGYLYVKSLQLIGTSDTHKFYLWVPKLEMSGRVLIALQATRIVVIVTRGQFWPSGIVVACVCLSVCVSVRASIMTLSAP